MSSNSGFFLFSPSSDSRLEAFSNTVYRSIAKNPLATTNNKKVSLFAPIIQEYADRMDELREMYRVEMDAQSEKFDTERAKMSNLESSLKDMLKTKRAEVDELRLKSNEAEKKVAELTVRLENQVHH